MTNIKEYFKLEKAKLIDNQNYKFSLAIIQVGENKSSELYANNKIKDCKEIGICPLFLQLKENSTVQEVKKAIDNFNGRPNTGIILQLPLPTHLQVYTDEILNTIYKHQDVDGFTQNSLFKPCTAKGIIDWLDYNSYDLTDKNVAIFGRGKTSGKSIADEMLKRNANISILHSYTSQKNAIEICKNADVIITCVGKPNYFKNLSMCQSETLIIDVGISFDENGKLCGDVEHNDCNNNCIGFITPVPNGVGLLTRLALLKNVLGVQ